MKKILSVTGQQERLAAIAAAAAANPAARSPPSDFSLDGKFFCQAMNHHLGPKRFLHANPQSKAHAIFLRPAAKPAPRLPLRASCALRRPKARSRNAPGWARLWQTRTSKVREFFKKPPFFGETEFFEPHQGEKQAEKLHKQKNISVMKSRGCTRQPGRLSTKVVLLPCARHRIGTVSAHILAFCPPSSRRC